MQYQTKQKQSITREQVRITALARASAGNKLPGWQRDNSGGYLQISSPLPHTGNCVILMFEFDKSEPN